MQLQSGDHYTIVRQLDNPADTNTYYVRAYIRKSLDDTLLDTINLTDKGNQRFTKEWQVVTDTSGQGMYIDIETRTFTDSGYTTESTVYGRENVQLLVQQRYNPVYGGGGGGSIDYKKVRQIIKEEIEKLPKTDTKPILGAIKGIVIPKQEKVDLGGIARLIENLRMKVEKLPTSIPEPEKIDLSGILNGIDRIQRVINEYSKNLLTKEDGRKLLDESGTMGMERKKQINQIQELLDEFRNVTFVTLKEKISTTEEKPKNEKPWRNNY